MFCVLTLSALTGEREWAEQGVDYGERGGGRHRWLVNGVVRGEEVVGKAPCQKEQSKASSAKVGSVAHYLRVRDTRCATGIHTLTLQPPADPKQYKP